MTAPKPPTSQPTSQPTTYDQITRATVPEPDSSFRPSPAQVQQAREGFRALDADEQRLADRVHAALAASGAPLAQVQVEVDHARVTLRGRAPDAEALARVVEVVRGVADIGEVTDLLVVG